MQAVVDGRRRDHDARRLAVRAVDGLVEVALLGLGRHSRRRSGALGVDDHGGNLGGAGQADQLGHQRKTRAGRGGHRLRAGEACAEHGRQRGDLVLGLDRDAVHRRKARGEDSKNVRRRRDRVAGVVGQARVQRAGDDRLVAGEQNALALGLVRVLDVADVGKVLAGVARAGAQRRDVRLADVALVRVALEDQLARSARCRCRADRRSVPTITMFLPRRDPPASSAIWLKATS